MGLRSLPFFKAKKGWQFAGGGGGLSADGGGGGGGGGEIVHYSTEPRVVGKWYDGRVCYEVTIVTTSKTVDISSYNIDEFYCVGGYTKFQSGNKYSQPYYDSTSERTYFRINNSTPDILNLGTVGDETVFTLHYAQKTA